MTKILTIASLSGRYDTGRSDYLTCTSGFPSRDRLTSDLVRPAEPSTRLIPEMNFVCSGSVVGFTVAMNRKRGAVGHPAIQIWRPVNCSQSITLQQSRECLYRSKGMGIPIHEAVCVDVARNELSEVFHCKLNGSVQVSVQPGDILGLQLPQRNSLSFAKVLKGPTNFVFEPSLSLDVRATASALLLSERNSTNQELPQITLAVESVNGEFLCCKSMLDICVYMYNSNVGSDCFRGFPEIPVGKVRGYGVNGTTVTLLIPEMNFTCDETLLAGFTFTGKDQRKGEEQDPRIQIWRENDRQPGIYYRTGSAISIHLPGENSKYLCDDGAIKLKTVSRTHWCILREEFQITIQSGDILGLEVPPPSDDDFELFFTSGGPTNHVFHRPLNSTVNLSNHDEEVQQIPQITFSLTSGETIFKYVLTNLLIVTSYSDLQRYELVLLYSSRLKLPMPVKVNDRLTHPSE